MRTEKIPYQTRYLKSKSRSTYITSLLSISLVLFFLGLFIALVLFGGAFAQNAREAIVMKVFLHDGIRNEVLKDLEKRLGTMPFVREIRYVSKEEAGKTMLEKTGEDVTALMDGVNPLLASFNVKLYPSYIQADSLIDIQEKLSQEKIVAEVAYPADMIINLNRNIQIISLVFLTVGLILIGIGFYLIFGTIRLAIYAERLTIRSMQLIGATQSFIRRPFLINGMTQGGLAGIIASALLIVSVVFLRRWLESLQLGGSFSLGGTLIGLLAGIVLFGLALGLSGSFFAVNKYLNRNLDELL
ncbi:MAG: permease-like cell division protein FtsX [Bacteroidia bacterium]|nr:permease-like cell division protein FtsX [Bacteroidia bacterium]